ncbi:MAG: hypothetical protein AAB373_04600 [Patescibacteria group bacterium]
MKEAFLDTSYAGKVVEAYESAGKVVDPQSIREEVGDSIKVVTGSEDHIRELETARLLTGKKLTMGVLRYAYRALQKLVRVELVKAGNNLEELRGQGFLRKMLESLNVQIELTAIQVMAAQNRRLTKEESEMLEMCSNLCRYERAYVIDLIESVISDVENEELQKSVRGRVDRTMWN